MERRWFPSAVWRSATLRTVSILLSGRRTTNIYHWARGCSPKSVALRSSLVGRFFNCSLFCGEDWQLGDAKCWNRTLSSSLCLACLASVPFCFRPFLFVFSCRAIQFRLACYSLQQHRVMIFLLLLITGVFGSVKDRVLCNFNLDLDLKETSTCI